MAKNTKNSLIGFNPLSSLDEEDIAVSDSPAEVVANVESSPEIESVAKPAAGIKPESMHSDSISFSLQAVITIANIKELHQNLIQALTDYANVEIDASAVTAIDTAAMQLLVVAHQTAGKSHKQMSIDFASEKFIEAAELLGLSRVLNVERPQSGLF